MVLSVEEEVHGDEEATVGGRLEVEEPAVHGVLNERPHHHTAQEQHRDRLSRHCDTCNTRTRHVIVTPATHVHVMSL